MRTKQDQAGRKVGAAAAPSKDREGALPPHPPANPRQPRGLPIILSHHSGEELIQMLTEALMARALQFTRGSQRSVLYLTHRINVSKWISREHSM